MKNNNQKRDKVLAIGITVLALIVILGVGYAFFSASVSNTNHETVSTETATLSLKFDDGDNGVSGNLNLGESISKKFTLQNTGTLDAYAKINWKNIVNTYMQGSLTYNLEQSESEDGTYTSIGSGNVPVSSTETTEVLKNGILVPVNTTYYYKLTITFNNLDINQNSDINAAFHSFFSLEEGSLSGVDKIKNLVEGSNVNSLDVITKESPVGSSCTNTLAYDGTSDNNLRYVGINPCNYVTFNEESPVVQQGWIIANSETGKQASPLFYKSKDSCEDDYNNVGSPSGWECKESSITTGGWRIIGVMNNVDDGTGKKETRIKLIRTDALGNYYWDTSESNVNYGGGVNDWTQADLMQELNGDYLNTSLTANTMWYDGYNNQKTAEYDYTKGLKAIAQSQIGDAKWHLGGMKDDNNDLIPSTMYTKERGTEVWGSSSGQTCNDGACPRATSWTGKVALIYPSDYGYATAGGEVTNRSSCINTLSLYYNKSGETWNNISHADCYTNNWISYQLLLSPVFEYAYLVFSDMGIGNIAPAISGNIYPTHPAVYLKSDVSITDGNGSPESPYTLE